MATVAKNARSTTINLVTGSAGPFNLGFRLFDDDAVDVFVNGVRNADWTLSSSYSDGFDDSATITFDASLDDGDAIIIEANLTPGRAADYIGSDPLLVQKMNIEMARLWSSVADLHRGMARTLRGFSTLDPVSGIDLETIAEAEANATAAAASASAAAASAALATSAQENLFDAWNSAWLTATAYVAGDLVREAGSTYICLSGHTSGTFSTDLAALKWEIFAQQGSAGAGTGDMLAANNLNDVASLSSARSNLEALYSQTTALSSTDLNSLSGSGLRKIGSANTNGWAGIVAGDMLLHLDYDANAAVQVGYRRASEPLVYMRRKNAGTWGSWYATASQSYVDAAIAAVSTASDGGPVSTTSGGTADIGSIPAGVNEIDVLLNGVSLTGTENLLVQFKVAGVAVASGYVSRSAQMGSGGNAYSLSTIGMIVRSGSSAAACYGILRLRRIPGTNDWVQDHSVQREGATFQVVGGGRVTLAGDPDGIRLTPDGSDTFDGGTFAIRFKT